MQDEDADGSGDTADGGGDTLARAVSPTEGNKTTTLSLDHGGFVTALAENVLMCAVLWLGLTTACELLIQESDYTPAIRWALIVQPVSLGVTAVLICLAYGSASSPAPLLSQISHAYCTHTLCVLVVYISIYLQAVLGDLDDTKVNSQHGDPPATYSFSVQDVWAGYTWGAGSAVVQDPLADEGSVVWVQQQAPLFMSVVLFGIMCAYLGLMWILSCYLALTTSSSYTNMYEPFHSFWYITQFCNCNILVSLGLPLMVDYLYMDCTKLGYEILLIVNACIVLACWQQAPLSMLWKLSPLAATCVGIVLCVPIVLVPVFLQRWVLMYIGMGLSGICVCMYVMAWLHEAANEPPGSPKPRADAREDGKVRPDMDEQAMPYTDDQQMIMYPATDEQSMMDPTADIYSAAGDHRRIHQTTDGHRRIHQSTDDHRRIHQSTDDHRQMHQSTDDHRQIHQSTDDHRRIHQTTDDRQMIRSRHTLQSPPSFRSQHTPSTTEVVQKDARRRTHTRNASIGGHHVEYDGHIKHRGPIKHGGHDKHEGNAGRDYAQDMRWSFPSADTSVFAGYKKA